MSQENENLSDWRKEWIKRSRKECYEIIEKYPKECYFYRKRLKSAKLSKEQEKEVLFIIMTTCSSCSNNYSDCTCFMDC